MFDLQVNQRSEGNLRYMYGERNVL